MVLSEFPRDAWHIRAFPGEDVPILTEKLDERAFLFIRQPAPDDELLGRITRDKVNSLCVFSRLELGLLSGVDFFNIVVSAGSTFSLYVVRSSLAHVESAILTCCWSHSVALDRLPSIVIGP